MADIQEATRLVRVMMRDGNYFDLPAPGQEWHLSRFLAHWKSSDFYYDDAQGVGLRWSEMVWCRVMYGVQTVIEKPKLSS